MNVGEPRIMVGNEPNIGPMVIEVGQERLPAPPFPKVGFDAVEQKIEALTNQVSEFRDEARARLDRLSELLISIEKLSMPWYVRFRRWLERRLRCLRGRR